MKMATFWTYTDEAIAHINIYASNNLGNYKRFGDSMFLDFYHDCLETIECLKCYDVQLIQSAEIYLKCGDFRTLYGANSVNIWC